jgi:hypothetical protein
MAADEGQAVCLPRRCSRYGSWSIACSRCSSQAFEAAVCCRIKGARGPWITDPCRAKRRLAPGATQTGIPCTRSRGVRRPARPVGYGHSTGPGTGDRTCPAGQSGRDHGSARRRRGWPCPDRARDQFSDPRPATEMIPAASPDRVRPTDGKCETAIYTAGFDDIGAVSCECATTASALMRWAGFRRSCRARRGRPKGQMETLCCGILFYWIRSG